MEVILEGINISDISELSSGTCTYDCGSYGR